MRVMSNFSQKTIDLSAVGNTGEQHAGCAELAVFSRLKGIIVPSEGTVEFSINLIKNLAGQTLITGTIVTTLMLQCQRCMQPMAFPCNISPMLCIVDDSAAEDTLPEGFEAITVPTEGITLQSIIEEEILLNLPTLARHEQSECAFVMPEALAEAKDEQQSKAFAALEEFRGVI